MYRTHNGLTTNSLEPFLRAVHDLDPAQLGAALADDVVMHSPILTEPLTGRDRVLGVLGAVFDAVDEFVLGEVLSGPEHFGIALSGKIDDEYVEG